MNNYNKQGKLFLLATVMLAILSIYFSLKGYNFIKFTSVKWFVLLGTLFSFLINLFFSIKEKKIYYTIGISIIIITGLIFYLIPQLIMFI